MSDPYLLKLIPLMQVRVRAIECAGKNTSLCAEKHIEAIAQGLSFARDPLRYATRSLWTAGNSKIKEQQHQAIHKQFMCGIFFLMSAFDAMVVVDASVVDDLSAEMNFFSTPLKDPAQFRIQEDIKALESFQMESNTQSADLQTVNNFFKHYMPVEQSSKTFTVKNVNGANTSIQDIVITFGEESGPILYDLVVPAFNKACGLLKLIGKAKNMDVEVDKIDMI
jgi:hypothetical protein